MSAAPSVTLSNSSGPQYKKKLPAIVLNSGNVETELELEK